MLVKYQKLIYNKVMDIDKAITSSEAAKILGTSPSYVARLCRKRILKAKQFGKSWLIDPESVMSYKNNPRKPGPPKGQGGRPRESK